MTPTHAAQRYVITSAVHPEARPRPVTRADLDWWLALAPTLNWRKSSTMPDAPHSYVVRDKTLLDPDFDRAVRVIRTYGRPGKFYRSTQIYLHDPDPTSTVKWWTMTGTVDEQGVINRADDTREYGEQNAPDTSVHHHPHPPHPNEVVAEVYDELATIYDDRYDSTHCHECEQENLAIRRLITRHFGAYAPTTLDVGCGTGLLLDLGITSPAIYTGLDQSQGMLNHLVQKHPRATALLPQRMEDAIKDGVFVDRQFDLVASLFGSPSYLEPWAIDHLPRFSNGMTVLMHYREGYWPDYWPAKPPNIDESRRSALNLPNAEHFSLNNMVVTVVIG